jgi:hypothetical protein
VVWRKVISTTALMSGCLLAGAGTVSADPTGLPHPSPLFDSLPLAFNGFNELGVMEVGGDRGAFTFRPESVGPAVGACTAPLSATCGVSSLSYHGRISVTPTPGAGQFGGSMGMRGSGATGVINANNNQGAGATPDRATGHMWMADMVTASITAGNVPPFQAITMTGSHSRITTGPDAGSGNLALVTSVLTQNLSMGATQVRSTVMSINLPEPGRALGIGAGALALILVDVSCEWRLSGSRFA